MTALAAPAADDGSARGGVHALQKAMSLVANQFVPFALHVSTFKKPSQLKTARLKSQSH